MVQIKNLQTLKRINKRGLTCQIAKVLKLINLDKKTIFFVFCDNNFIKKLNYRYFKKNKPTDVISFNLNDGFNPDLLGEVVISVEEALKNSKIYKTGWRKELNLYIIHGILHLLGYRDYWKKDRAKMERKQQKLLKLLYKK